MRSISSLQKRGTLACWQCLLGVLVLFGGWASGQTDPANVAFVRMVNLVSPGEGNLKMRIDGEDPWPAGYRLGQRTGGIGMKAGKRKFVLSKEGCLSAEREIPLKGGKTVTLAIYAEPVLDEETGKPVLDENGEVAEWQIKVASLNQVDPGEGYHLTFVSFCVEEVIDIEVKPAASDSFFAQVKRLTTTKRQFASNRDRVAIVYQDKVLDVLKGRIAGNYVVMIYEGVDGKDAISFYDPKFVLAE